MRPILTYTLTLAVALQFLMLPLRESVVAKLTQPVNADVICIIEQDDEAGRSNLVLKVGDAIDNPLSCEVEFQSVGQNVKHYFFFSLQNFFPASPLRGPPSHGLMFATQESA